MAACCRMTTAVHLSCVSSAAPGSAADCDKRAAEATLREAAAIDMVVPYCNSVRLSN